jgi:hypothetical protein
MIENSSLFLKHKGPTQNIYETASKQVDRRVKKLYNNKKTFTEGLRDLRG